MRLSLNQGRRCSRQRISDECLRDLANLAQRFELFSAHWLSLDIWPHHVQRHMLLPIRWPGHMLKEYKVLPSIVRDRHTLYNAANNGLTMSSAPSRTNPWKCQHGIESIVQLSNRQLSLSRSCPSLFKSTISKTAKKIFYGLTRLKRMQFIQK